MQIGRGVPSRRVDLFGGSGEVLVWNLLQGATAPPFTAVLSCELAPAGHVGRHRQEQFPEILVGLTGHGEATIEGETRPLGPGAVLHVPLGHRLELRNGSSSEPLRYLIIKARAGS